MHLLVATDAWRPQVNGVVRTIEETARAAERFGVRTSVLGPDAFRTAPMPYYPEIRLALTTPGAVARAIEARRPDAVHIATEGPIGWLARRWCMASKTPFTTSYHTRFPQYVSARLPIPERLIYSLLRKFHSAAALTLVATASIARELEDQGFRHIGFWARGVDTVLFDPVKRSDLGYGAPVFLYVGRLAVEKNVSDFLALDLPGVKVVVGDGPQRRELEARFPRTVFLGAKHGEELARIYAGADVFVFPSKTDTYGLVQLEALASGVPVAAFPTPGPLDVLAGCDAAALDTDLKRACLTALTLSREAARAFALERSWEACARDFIAAVAQAGGVPFATPAFDLDPFAPSPRGA